MKDYEHMAACNHQLSNYVQKVINDGRVCLTLGGDHSIGMKIVILYFINI